MPDSKRRFALKVVTRLQESGYQALWAGGCVRDILMGNTPEDYDVATDARPETVRSLFSRTLAVGASFGVIVVLGGPEEGQIEVATFRTENSYTDGRHPDHVQFSTPEADAGRRDFTINGMFLDPVSNDVHDFVGGREDLKRGVLRAIGDPRERFAEDKLRLLRAVRFAARFGFTMDTATSDALCAMADQISLVSAERIQQELKRMFLDSRRASALSLADSTGLLAAILPEVHAMHGVPQNKPVQADGDLWDHTLLVLEKTGEAWRTTTENLSLKDATAEPSFPLGLGALLHDVGKPKTMRRTSAKLTFHNHEHVGEGIADRIARRLRLSNHERERVKWLVEYHMYLADAKRMRISKLKSILVHEGIAELLALHRADALASTGSTEAVDYCERKLRELPQAELNPPPLLTGDDLLQIGLKPGPIFKGFLEKVREAQLEGELSSKQQALELVEQLLDSETDTELSDTSEV